MKIVDYTSVAQNMQDTSTVQNFGALLGKKPHKLGQVVSLYPHLAISTLTDSLGNVYQKKKGDRFTPVRAMAVEWSIDVNYIKKVFFAKDNTDTGVNKEEFTISLKERYYDKGDTLVLENRQQLFITSTPRKVHAEEWEYTVKVVGNDKARGVDTRFTARGKFTRYRSNYFPELSERGYIKYTSNTEIHRNWISRHRASVVKSGDFNVMEATYIQDGYDKDSGKSLYFKLEPAEKRCMDHFLVSREHACLFGETNFDQNNKCLDQDAEGKDIEMGDGIVTQIERYCDKFSYAIMTTDIFEDILAAMRAKSDTPTGNSYTMCMNERLFDQVQRLMKNDLRLQSSADGAYYYSKGAASKLVKGGIKAPNGMPITNPVVKVGTHFVAYEFSGNQLNFVVDRALSQEYHDHGYGIFLDTGVTQGTPNLAMFTLEGRELISGNLNGMGGQDGKTSGVVSTGVDGSEYHLLGYSCAVLFNPYKAAVLEESRALL